MAFFASQYMRVRKPFFFGKWPTYEMGDTPSINTKATLPYGCRLKMPIKRA
jgi:hypothetical protein